MLRQEVSSPNKVPFWIAGVFTVGMILGMVTQAVISHAMDRIVARAQITHSDELDVDLIGWRSDPYRGPSEVLGCLYDGGVCMTRWLPYAAIEEIADRALDSHATRFPGRLYVKRHDGLHWQERVFLLP
ncbi:MAG: hypothetical protein AAB554_02915 [Patescibacteria group bacterium]